MSNSFNLENFLNNAYKTQTYDPTKLHAAAEAKMEEKLVQKAEEAVSNGFLSLTLSEKLAEMGVGKRVMQQVADTANNLLLGAINPLEEYLEKYEKVFDERVFKSELHDYAWQMFSAGQAMAKANKNDGVGRNFVYDM